ncbi:hypothetical protein PMAYCL1PPCAC_15095, partial [Pristionchus mayeri]
MSIGPSSNSVGWQVISDTGTSLIGAPDYIVEQVAAYSQAHFEKAYGLYILPSCSTKILDLNLVIGSTTYTISSENLVFPFPLFSGPTWILGDPFIRQYCQIYDVGYYRMGFARSLQ